MVMGNDNYCECLVQAEPDGKNRLLTIVSIIVAVLCAAAGMFVFLPACIPAIGCGVYAWFCSQKINTEYEYLLLDHEISVDVIYNKNRRKKLMNCPVKKIELFAPADLGKLDHVKRQNIKLEDYSTRKDQDRHYLMVCSNEGGKMAFLLTPGTELLDNFSRELNRNVFTR